MSRFYACSSALWLFLVAAIGCAFLAQRAEAADKPRKKGLLEVLFDHVWVWPTEELQISPAAAQRGAGDARSDKILSLADAAAIARCPGVASAAPVVKARTFAHHGDQSWIPLFIYGSTPAFLETRRITKLAAGQAFTDKDVQAGRRVCLVGPTLVHKLFADKSPLGEEVSLLGLGFKLKVIGVLPHKEPDFSGWDRDDILLAPWTVIRALRDKALNEGGKNAGQANNVIDPNDLANLYRAPASAGPAGGVEPEKMPLDLILVRLKPSVALQEATEQLTTLLRKQHHLQEKQPDDFVIRDVPAVPALPAKTAVPRPQRPQTKADDKVREAIHRGVTYLRNAQAHGHWEDELLAQFFKGGRTPLALLALLESGVPVDDPAISKGLDYLRGTEPGFTYVISLQILVFSHAGQPRDKEMIQRNVNRLWAARSHDARGQFCGWSYTKTEPNSGLSDNSNTEFAAMALDAGARAGAIVPGEAWQQLRDLYLVTQQQDGGWPYLPHQHDSSFTMTIAGVCGLLTSNQYLNKNERVNQAVTRGLGFLGDGVTGDLSKQRFYCLYSLGRLGRLRNSGTLTSKTGKPYDFYRLQTQWLLEHQRDDGSWSEPKSKLDFSTGVSTSFALLFLTAANRGK